MCNKEVDIKPCSSALVSDHLKTEEMCNRAVRREPYTLRYVRDWLITQQQLKIWPDDEDNLFKWYDGYKKRKEQKVQIKEELLPIAWHPLGWWNCCVSEDEKKTGKKTMGIRIGLLYLMTEYKNFLTIKFNPHLILRV